MKFAQVELIAQRRFAVVIRQTGFMAAAGVAAAIGLVLLNVAAYIASERCQEHARHDLGQWAAYREGLALAAKWLTTALEAKS